MLLGTICTDRPAITLPPTRQEGGMRTFTWPSRQPPPQPDHRVLDKEIRDNAENEANPARYPAASLRVDPGSPGAPGYRRDLLLVPREVAKQTARCCRPHKDTGRR